MARKCFTSAGAELLKWAEATAVLLGHSYVGSDHLLLALTRTEHVGPLLEREGLSADRVARAMEDGCFCWATLSSVAPLTAAFLPPD